MNQFR